MRAVIHTKYGSPEVLKVGEREKPQPKDNEVLIKVHAAIVSPSDCAFRKGEPFIARFFSGLLKPKNAVPGELFSGEVEAVGKSVTLFSKGDPVFGSTGLGLGAYAEYLSLSEKEVLVRKSGKLTHAEAAALGDGPLTALPFLRDNGKIKSGQKILIIGASGSVGSAGVQLAKYFGANVTGVCTTANAELVKSLGADNVIDYTKENFAANGEIYDIIFDAVGKSSFSQCKAALKEGGIYLTTVPTPAAMLQMLFTSKFGSKKADFAATGLRKPDDKIKDLIFLQDLMEKKSIKPVMDRTYPLEKISEAHGYVDGGHKKGNVVITI